MSTMSCLMAVAALLPGELPESYYHDFRASRRYAPELPMYGADPARFTRRDGGLCVKLPPRRGPTGVSTAFSLAGDFEITASFEILSIPESSRGGGVRLWLTLETPAAEMAKIAWTRPERRFAFEADLTGADGKPSDKRQERPTTAKQGKLRLQRTGGKLLFSVAERAGKEFTVIHEAEIGSEDVRTVTLAGTTSFGEGEVEVRLIDLGIRAEKIGTGARFKLERAEGATARIGLAVLLVLSVGGFVGAGYLVKRRRRTAGKAEGTAQACRR